MTLPKNPPTAPVRILTEKEREELETQMLDEQTELAHFMSYNKDHGDDDGVTRFDVGQTPTEQVTDPAE